MRKARDESQSVGSENRTRTRALPEPEDPKRGTAGSVRYRGGLCEWWWGGFCRSPSGVVSHGAPHDGENRPLSRVGSISVLAAAAEDIMVVGRGVSCNMCGYNSIVLAARMKVGNAEQVM